MAEDDGNSRNRLRGLWLFHLTGGLNNTRAAAGLNDRDERVRAWTVRLILDDDSDAQEWLETINKLAENDPSTIVRRAIAGGLSRIPRAQRWDAVLALSKHEADAQDPLLPHLVWFAFEPAVEIDLKRGLTVALESALPTLLPNTVRRIAAMSTPAALELLAKQLASDESSREEAILAGMTESLKGRRQVAMPPSWPEAFEKLQKNGNAAMREKALALGLKFGDPAARTALRSTLTDISAAHTKRQVALSALVESRDPELVPTLFKLVYEPALAGPALRALALYDHADTPGIILKAYVSLGPNEKRDALATLAARPAYAKALVAAIKAKQLPVGDVSAAVVRQLRALRDPSLDAAVTEVWGVARAASPAERTQLIADWKKKLSATKNAPVDLSAGRAVFAKACASCHKLFGEGGDVGPDITGANRANLDYLLENTLDPSAVIPKDYTATRLDLAKGTTVICIVKSETPTALTVVTDRETLTIPKSDIASREPSDTSMMPDDLLKPLTESEIRALFAYLQSTKQAPLPAGFVK